MTGILTFVLLLTSSNIALAEKVAVQGESISADKINSSIAQIGEIKQSILNQAQHQSLYGDCWRLMDGSSLDNTDLKIVTGMNNLPDLITNGEFLRQATASAPVGTIQGDAIRNITGYTDTSDETNTYVTASGAYYVTNGPNNSFQPSTSGRSWKTPRINFDASRVVPTATENRPKNLSVNFFIKANKNCNFN